MVLPPKIFISHTHSEASIVGVFIDLLRNSLEGEIIYFSSSDGRSIVGGDEWFSKTKIEIEKTSIMLVLCSPLSVSKHWISFEFGYALSMKKRIIPICHSGLKPTQLKAPYNLQHAYDLSIIEDLERIIELIAETFGIPFKKINYNSWISAFNKVSKSTDKTEVITTILSGKDVIYSDAIQLISSAVKTIRLTAFGSPEIEVPMKEKYLLELFNKLDTSKRSGQPIECYVITSSIIKKQEHAALLKQYNITDLLKIKYLETVRFINLLIVDNDFAHISLPEIKADNASFRKCIKYEKESGVIDSFVDWFDNYLWNKIT